MNHYGTAVHKAMWWLDTQFSPSLNGGGGALKMVDAGDNAPEYKLPAHDGSEVCSAAFKGKKPVVLFYYPKAHTSG